MYSLPSSPLQIRKRADTRAPLGARYKDAIPTPPLNSLDNSPFKQLPTEIIGSIAAFLPLSAAVSFTLTCRSVWFILGSQYLDRLREDQPDGFDRPVFLDILQRDLPRHILCLDCEMLHSRAQLEYLRLPDNLTPCTKADYASSVHRYIHDGFDSVTFLLVMKLHRSGLNCDELLSSLSEFRSILIRGAYDTTHILHEEFAPRIADGRFLLRHQIWLLLPLGRKVEVPRKVYTCICPHWDFIVPYSHSTELTRKLTCRASHWKNPQLNSSCSTCAGLFQCEACPTEFQIDAMDFSDHNHGVALIITCWLDLGEGRNLLDSKYKSRVSCYRGDPVPFKAGSIKAAYEGGDINIVHLLTPKYKADMFKHRLL